MGFFIALLVIAALVGAYVFRVPLLAKILGQPRSRIERQLGRRRD